MRPNVNVTVGGPVKPTNYTYKTVVLKSNLPFADQIGDPNCIYVIKWDFNLNGETVTIPENCVLKFEGGSLRNGTIVGQNTHIDAEDVKIFNTDIELSGTWNVDAKIRWFGASPEFSDNTLCIQKMLDTFGVVTVDEAIYKTDALQMTKCYYLKGCDGVRGEHSGFSFVFNGSTRAGLTTIFNPDYPYIKVENLQFAIEGVTDYIEGTVGIDLSSSTHNGTPLGNTEPIRCNGCSFFYFETCVKSNHMSFYNYFNNCVFKKIKYGLYNFSSNNLIVTQTYAAQFDIFIYALTGGGPVTIDKCSLEKYNVSIVTGYNFTGVVNFINNYVETEKGCLLSGNIEAINSRNNDIQIEADVTCLYYLLYSKYNAGTEQEPVIYYYGCRNLISEGNFILVATMNHRDENDNNSPYKFKYFRFSNEDARNLLENFVAKDAVRFVREFNPSLYQTPQPYIKDYKTVVEGYDPISRNIYACPYAGIDPVIGNGYSESEKPLRVRTRNSIAYFYGKIKKTDTVITEGQEKIFVLPLSVLGNPDVDWDTFNYFDLHVYDSDGDPILLRWWPKEITDGDEENPQVVHEAGSVDFIKGDTTKDIVFDGLVLNF